MSCEPIGTTCSIFGRCDSHKMGHKDWEELLTTPVDAF